MVTPAVLVPAWLRHYERRWLRGDVLAGVTVTAYLIPQVMAYAGIAGMPPGSGLWAAAGAMLAYALIGSSPVLSVGPESTTALMTAAAVGAAITSPDQYASLSVALCLVVGSFCLLGAAGGLARVSDLLSRPVMVGYLAGVAGIMIVSQLGKLTRMEVRGDGFLGEIGFVVGHWPDIHVPTLVLGLGSALLMILGSRWWPHAPVALIGMVTASLVVWAFALTDHGIMVIGTIRAGVPRPGWPDLTVDSVTSLLLPAVGVAFVAYSDNILTARAFAMHGEHQIDPRRELFALGAANIGAGVLQGFPVSSSGSRTAIAAAVGAKSQAAGLVTVVMTVLAVVFLRPALAAFPTAALGGVVIYAATRLVELSEFRRFARFRRSELAIAVITAAAVLVVGVLNGILVAVGLSIADMLRRVARPHDAVLGLVPHLAGMHDVDDYPDARVVPGLMIYRYDSPLFFANAEDFRHRALGAIRAAGTPVRWFVLNAEATSEVDITATDALDQLYHEVTDQGIVFALARVKQELADELRRTGFLDLVGAEHVFPTLPTAVEAFRHWEASGMPPARSEREPG